MNCGAWIWKRNAGVAIKMNCFLVCIALRIRFRRAVGWRERKRDNRENIKKDKVSLYPPSRQYPGENFP